MASDEIANSGTITVGDDVNGANNASFDILGPLTLDGGGKVTLGAVQPVTNILSRGEIGGDSLTNVNNTITGVGDFSLNSLYNESGGAIDASKVQGRPDSLNFNVGSFVDRRRRRHDPTGRLRGQRRQTLRDERKLGYGRFHRRRNRDHPKASVIGGRNVINATACSSVSLYDTDGGLGGRLSASVQQTPVPIRR